MDQFHFTELRINDEAIPCIGTIEEEPLWGKGNSVSNNPHRISEDWKKPMETTMEFHVARGQAKDPLLMMLAFNVNPYKNLTAEIGGKTFDVVTDELRAWWWEYGRQKLIGRTNNWRKLHHRPMLRKPKRKPRKKGVTTMEFRERK